MASENVKRSDKNLNLLRAGCTETSTEISAMEQKKSDDDSTEAESREIEQDRSRFTVMPVILVNAFLFSTCFFMGNSVFPVSIYLTINTPNVVSIDNRRLFVFRTVAKLTQSHGILHLSVRTELTDRIRGVRLIEI